MSRVNVNATRQVSAARVSAGWSRWLAFAPSAVADDGLNAAKLVAIVLMLANHVLLAFPQPWPYWGYLIGRPCIPIFAYLMAARLAAGPLDRNLRLLVRLLLWGLVAQPIYYALVSNFTLRLNVLLTLAAGAGLVFLLRKRFYVPLILAAVVLIVGNFWLDGGALLPLGMLAAYAVYERSQIAALVIVTAAAAVNNQIATPGVLAAHLTVLVAPALILISPHLARFTPRMRGLVFYMFYPAHLLGIWLAFGAYR